MQITFLGTSAGVPTKSRNVSSVALRLPQRGEVWLFDCGEGTQHQLQHTDLRISQITRIFITHLHGDHLFGLMGLLATIGMAGQAQSVEVYGPAGLGEYVRACARYSRTNLSERINVRLVEPGVIFGDDEFVVACEPLRHRLISYGYRVAEAEQPGRFDAERAGALGVPTGPLYGRLKRGETITLDDGRSINGAEFVGPAKKGRVVVYCTDTTYCESAVRLARDADLLIHEATFAGQDAALAEQSWHSTAGMAARVALEADARRLYLTHFSPRYAPGGALGLNDLLAQARAVFPASELAHDFLTVEVPRPQTHGGYSAG